MGKKIYLLEVFLDIASQFVVPFISLYAIYLGFSNFFIGMFNSLLSASHLLVFFLSPFLTEWKIIRKVMSLALITWGFSFVLLYYARTESLFALSIIIRAISSSVISISYTWLISKVFKQKTFEKVSNLTIINTIITLLATLVSGIIINTFSYPIFIFYVPFVFSLLSVILISNINLKKEEVESSEKSLSFKYRNIKDLFLYYFKNKSLKNYLIVIFFFYFSVGIAGPFFSVFLKRVLNLTEVEWAIIIIVEMLSFLILSSALKRVKGSFTIIEMFRVSTFLISLIPLVWVLSKNFVIILFYSIFSGLGWQLFSISHLTYISKKFGMMEKISLVSVFTGLGLIIGNLLGGFLSGINIEYTFFISFFFRFLTSMIFAKMLRKEKRISFEDFFKNFFVSIDFLSSLIKEFTFQIKLLVPYNHKKNIRKS